MRVSGNRLQGTDQHGAGPERAVRTACLGGRIWCLLLMLGLASCDGADLAANPIQETVAHSVATQDGARHNGTNTGTAADPVAAPHGVPAAQSDSGKVADAVAERRAARTLPTVSYPQVTPATEADHMRNDDLVLGVIVSGAARAYPWWIMKNYHGINDSIAETPVLITLCEQCTAAGAFRRVVGGRVVMMDMMGVYKGTIILNDRQTGSLWNPFDGIALEGPMAGEKLDRLPLFLTTWDDWKERHPDTDVVWDDERRRGGHGSWYEPGKWGIVNVMGKTIDTWDTRLAENELVYGIRGGNTTIAYPLAVVERSGGVLNESIDQTPIVLMKRGSLELVGYERRLGEQTLTFDAVGPMSGVIKDRQTGSLWDIEGNAVKGALAGQSLKRIDGYVTEWHVWSGYHATSKIYGTPGTDSHASFTFPTLALTALDGRPQQPVRLSGKVNLVALWAVWCPPCREEMPQLQSLYEEYADRGLSVVSIAVHPPLSTERRPVRQFVAQTKLRFPVFFMDEPGYEQIDSILRESVGQGILLPTILIVDGGGTVVEVLRGQDVSRVPKLVEEMLFKEEERSDPKFGK